MTLDEQIETIVGEIKQNKIFTSSEEHIDEKYSKLKEQHDALSAKDTESQKLIASLQEATNEQETVQNKIKEYESTIAKQSEELAKARTEAVLKVGLLSADAKDIDYLLFKMTHDENWKAVLDDDGHIKGLDDKVDGLKTQFPGQFESSADKKIEEKKLDKADDNEKISKEAFEKWDIRTD